MRKFLLAAAFVALSFPALSAPACVTIESNRAEAAKLGVPGENIVVVDDVEFMNAYSIALGLPIPDDSAPKFMMFVAIQGKVYIGLVEPDGCIRYSKVISLVKHSMAFKAATSGV